MVYDMMKGIMDKGEFYKMMSTTHLHITTWVIGIILFFVAYSLLKKGSPKAKMTHMITRLFYILIFLTGGMLISNFNASYADKDDCGYFSDWFHGNGISSYEKR